MHNEQFDFSHNLVKGRIAETVFEQMLRDAGCFTILAFGYENILPELTARQKDIGAKGARTRETMEIIRRAPDFVIIDNTSHEVYLVEVKYLMHPDKKFILQDAKIMYESWKPSYLFLATPEGFFFSKAKTIIEQGGIIPPLSTTQISKEIQTKYSQILNQFIVPTE